MRIAYIGDFINYGTSLHTSGSSLAIILSEIEEINSIDVYCPEKNMVTEEFQVPKKVNIVSFYKYDNPISILKLLSVQWKRYDIIIFNMLPTGFGKSSISNALGLTLPLFITKLLRNKNVRIIYHNSVFTNDFKALGYNSCYDKIRSYFLGKFEKNIFRNIPTYVLLNFYKDKIDKVVGKNKVRVLNIKYLDAVTTIYMNNLMEKDLLEIKKNESPMILLHGYWGPQKNIELALSSLSKIKSMGFKFRLTISGGINNHFPNYNTRFRKLLDTYSDIIYEYLGYVNERDLTDILLKADVLLLPYNVPGGLSGVLEQGMFFEIPIIAFDFPEYREQSQGNNMVKLIRPEDLVTVLIKTLNSSTKNDFINIKNKIEVVRNNIKSILV